MAARYGLPPGCTVRHLVILLALVSGPKEGVELSRACGFKVPQKGGCSGGSVRTGQSYLAALLGWGLVAAARSPGPGRNRPNTYMLTGEAMNALAAGAKGAQPW